MDTVDGLLPAGPGIAPGAPEDARYRTLTDYGLTRRQFPSELIHLELGTVPFVRVQRRRWELRFFPPAAVDVGHMSHGVLPRFRGRHRPTQGRLLAAFSLFDHMRLTRRQLSEVTMQDMQALLRWFQRLGVRGVTRLDDDELTERLSALPRFPW
ncbi:hypothetical protein [Streptomyces nanshensis]|uniref:Uncharacterized protein n=1 Tax=Streptomyces nanshensis TaxID=518642 RepID=A0A1E7L406_9ACTN|nr:hypothetical protein [Streptomyces nanshensis]OEV10920.1 hypothetical protein AN218_15385 [Streptomyces nanshensis]